MNLTEALAQSQPLPPTLQMANTVLPDKGSVSVASDGRFWDVTYLGCPFARLTQTEVEQFLVEEAFRSRRAGCHGSLNLHQHQGGGA